MNKISSLSLILLLAFFTSINSFANGPGGGTGTGPNVTVTDNGTTVVLSNGIVSATIVKATAKITNYSYKGYNMLSGGFRGGVIYWSWVMPIDQTPYGCTYSLNVDPSTSNGDYAEVQLHMKWPGDTASAPIDVDMYYSLTRGAHGIYASGMVSHPANYPTCPAGVWCMISYVGSTFDWLSVDSLRNRKMASPSDWTNGSPVAGAPKEVELLNTGVYKNMYECKYDYSADFGDINVWGWSSTARNVGIWMTAPSKEYYNGGPKKRELMCHNGPTMLNVLCAQHYGMGNDFKLDTTENYKKMYGPFLIYCNSVPLGTPNAQDSLFADAQAQAKTEQAAWPYTWFNNPNYLQDSMRGTVTGRLVIKDTTTPNVVAANMWVGVAQTPLFNDGYTDFQMWSKNYQFWVQTDSLGNFTIPHVHPGKYNIYAFGPSAAGQMTKLNYLNVSADSISALGDVVWTPTRTAPTIWEIGVPDRSAAEFRHGKDWWRSDTFPSVHWGKFMDYPNEFPNGVNYTIGQSNYATDWNFVMDYDKTVQTAAPVWSVNFNLTSAAKKNVNAAIYAAFAANFTAALIVKVNGILITSATGTIPSNPSDAVIRKGIHGAYSDMRLLFSGNLLKAGANTVQFTMRNTAGSNTGNIMFDYVRLEATGTSLGNPLPIKLLPLTITKQNTTAALHWATLTEQNNDHFEIERSADGNKFISINKIASKGNSTDKVDYDFVDNTPLNGVNYYRIKQVDKVGTFTYGNVVMVNFANKDNALKLYPNPAKDNVTLSFYAVQSGVLVASIINANGVVVKEVTINAVTGNNNYTLSLAGLAAGSHVITLRNDRQTISSRFEKL